MYILDIVNTPCPSPAQSCECGGASKSSAPAPSASEGARAPGLIYCPTCEEKIELLKGICFKHCDQREQ